jgi:hypothetical protein
VTVAPTEGSALERPAVALGCNECDEALYATRAALAAARRLAFVAQNALANGDLRRVGTAPRDLQDAATSGAPDAGHPIPVRWRGDRSPAQFRAPRVWISDGTFVATNARTRLRSAPSLCGIVSCPTPFRPA